MQTKGFTCYLQRSVPDAGLGWNLAFWRQSLSIVGGRRALVERPFVGRSPRKLNSNRNRCGVLPKQLQVDPEPIQACHVLSDMITKQIRVRQVTIFYFDRSPEKFVDFFFEFAWVFCIEKWQGFLVDFVWSPSPTKSSTQTPQKIRGKFGAKFGAKFGTKNRKIRETFVLPLFWPNNFWSSGAHIFHGVVRDCFGTIPDCPHIFLRFPGLFFNVFPFPGATATGNAQTFLTPALSWDNPEACYVYWLFVHQVVVKFELLWMQNGARNKPEPQTGAVGTVSPRTENLTVTVGTALQEPNRLLKLYRHTEEPSSMALAPWAEAQGNGPKTPNAPTNSTPQNYQRIPKNFLVVYCIADAKIRIICPNR